MSCIIQTVLLRCKHSCKTSSKAICLLSAAWSEPLSDIHVMLEPVFRSKMKTLNGETRKVRRVKKKGFILKDWRLKGELFPCDAAVVRLKMSTSNSTGLYICYDGMRKQIHSLCFYPSSLRMNGMKHAVNFHLNVLFQSNWCSNIFKWKSGTRSRSKFSLLISSYRVKVDKEWKTDTEHLEMRFVLPLLALELNDSLGQRFKKKGNQHQVMKGSPLMKDFDFITAWLSHLPTIPPSFL